jgi:hypothetical protein
MYRIVPKDAFETRPFTISSYTTQSKDSNPSRKKACEALDGDSDSVEVVRVSLPSSNKKGFKTRALFQIGYHQMGYSQYHSNSWNTSHGMPRLTHILQVRISFLSLYFFLVVQRLANYWKNNNGFL